MALKRGYIQYPQKVFDKYRDQIIEALKASLKRGFVVSTDVIYFTYDDNELKLEDAKALIKFVIAMIVEEMGDDWMPLN